DVQGADVGQRGSGKCGVGDRVGIDGQWLEPRDQSWVACGECAVHYGDDWCACVGHAEVCSGELELQCGRGKCPGGKSAACEDGECEEGPRGSIRDIDGVCGDVEEDLVALSCAGVKAGADDGPRAA